MHSSDDLSPHAEFFLFEIPTKGRLDVKNPCSNFLIFHPSTSLVFVILIYFLDGSFALLSIISIRFYFN